MTRTIGVARAHDDGTGTISLGGVTHTVATDSISDAMAALVAVAVEHARSTGEDLELVAHAQGTRTGLRIGPDGGISEDDRILIASLSRARLAGDQPAPARRRRRPSKSRVAATPPGHEPSAEPPLEETKVDQADAIDDGGHSPAVQAAVVELPAQPRAPATPYGQAGRRRASPADRAPEQRRPATPRRRPRRRAAVAAGTETASAPSAASQALQRGRTHALAALPPRSSANVLAVAALVVLVLAGAGWAVMSQGSDGAPATAQTTAPVGSATSSSAPAPADPTSSAPLPAAAVSASSPRPGRLILTVSGLTAGDRVTITLRGKDGKVRTAKRTATSKALRWSLGSIAPGRARWRVDVDGHRPAVGTVKVTAPPPPPAPEISEPDPEPDPAPEPDREPRRGGGSGGGGGGGGGPIDPATQPTGPVG